MTKEEVLKICDNCQIMIVVDYKGKTHLIENGKEIRFIKSLQFSVDGECVPVLNIEREFINKSIGDK